jgi:heme/copper-type cytochrome/quinol oxidase subunit 4
MSADEIVEKEEMPRKLSPEEKRQENARKIKRSAIATAMGIITGVISYLVIDSSQILGFQSYMILALLIMLAGVVVQKHIFMFMHLNTPAINKKDWFFQGFMTFAFWFITWTILLTSGIPA